MRERAIRFETTSGLRLAGTLAMPSGPIRARSLPAVMLVLGSYPALRDGLPDWRQGWFSRELRGTPTFAHVARRLANAGLASLRADKRGCGSSEGRWEDVDFEALVEDALAGVAALRGRPEVDPDRIGLLGQSEGGIIVLAAASRDPGIAAVLAQGSPGRGLFETRSDEAESLAATIDALPEPERRVAIDRAPGAYLFMREAAHIRAAVATGEHRIVLEEVRTASP